ncbi:MarR family transcriptional regulator [Intrasporangium oryzae NRRL B-24470]|uniref:MarR family transcriptional regulator n=1 Tax=Intrasporangium oryzae NRRL B-24470 TaxID=1386089 RepID=W9G939_9MICO|nr:DUF488 family protein [Intrasporangium oryzae]EWT01353.1 MarR family transcriptional regulator [Intrasporangium oryzae NRRL B-24470]
MELRTKRVYDEPSPDDGTRVLADRLWPRGITRERAHVALWAKEVAPSNELRQWYAHDPERFDEFEARYRAELDTPEGQAALRAVVDAVEPGGPLTLLTSTTAIELSHLAVLTKVLSELA